MKILIADDELTSRMLLEGMLADWGYTVISASNGDEAWKFIEDDEALTLAVFDWMMPGLDGLDLCRRIRSRENGAYIYTILLTGKTDKESLVEALDAGADDFLTKPVNGAELRSRVAVGQRIVRYEATLAEKIVELEDALGKIKTLRGLLPICASCKRVRDDQGYWNQLDTYVRDHSDAEFSHSICPTCQEVLYPSLKKNGDTEVNP